MKATKHETYSEKPQDLAQILTLLSGLIALAQWSQINYRLNLFYEQNHGQKGLNHIGDGDFAVIYFANSLLLAAGVFAVRAFWRGSSAWRISAALVTATNLTGCLTLFLMHRMGVLVEYSEFIRNIKRGS